MRRASLLSVGAPALAGLAAAAGVLTLGPATTLSVFAGLALVTLLVAVPASSLFIAVVLAFTTLPSAIPSAFILGPASVRAYEPFLFIAAAWAVAVPGGRRGLHIRCAAGLTAMVVTWSIVGIAKGNTISEVISDVRPLTYLIASVVIGGSVIGSQLMVPLIRTLVGVLWFSAAMTMLASATGFAVGGRTEQAAPYGAVVAADEATRLLTPATFLAVVVLCAALAALIRGGARVPWYLVVPSIPIVVLAFSRNHLLALATAAIFAFIASRGLGSTIPKSIGFLVASALTLGALTYGQGFVSTLPGGGYIVKQVDGFSSRVVEGVSSQALSRDSSAQYRFVQENDRIRPWVERSPFLGWGFGKAYKPPAAGDEFSMKQAPYYAHNYYWWLLLKSGAAGLVAFLLLTAGPALRVLRRPDPWAVLVAAPVVGLLSASFFAPMANGSPTSALLGALVGMTAALTGKRAATTASTARRPRSRTST